MHTIKYPYFLLVIFCSISINLNAHVFENLITQISQKTSLKPQTIKDGALISLALTTCTALVYAAIKYDNYCQKKQGLAENNLTDAEIIDEEKAQFQHYSNMFSSYLNPLTNPDQLKKTIITSNSFPYFLCFKSKLITAITICEKSIQRISKRLEPEFQENPHERNNANLLILKNDLETLTNQLYILKNNVNNFFQSSWSEWILLEWIKNGARNQKYGIIDSYYFAYLAEDLI